MPAQVGPHLGQPTSSAACHVLDEDEARPELADDAGELPPEAGAGPGEAGAFARERDILAGEAPADEVDPSEVVASDGVNIGKAVCIGPVLLQDGAAAVVEFNLPARLADAGPLEAEF